MKRFTHLAALFMLLLVPAAFAAGSSHRVTLNNGVMVNGKAVKPGQYNVKWQGTGNHVDVSFIQGKQVLATSPAQIVSIDSAPGEDTFVYRDNPDGSRSLVEMRFGGKKFALNLGEQTADASMNSSQASSTK